jgi:hypothetical protein
MARCLVIVSRDQPALFERLTSLYRDEEWLEILLDRRHGDPGTGMGCEPDRRSPPSLHTDLHKHAFIVIPRVYREPLLS